MTILTELAEFIKNSDGVRNLWIGDRAEMSAYVRRSRRCLYGNKLIVCLDIATVLVDERHQRQGLFAKFIAEAHQMNPWQATYIENVQAPGIGAFLLRQGWFLSAESPSFFLPKDLEDYYKKWLPNIRS